MWIMTASDRPPAREAEPAFGPAQRDDRDRAGGVDRVDFDPTYDATAPILCELCGSEMRYVAACKILCPNCGYKRDCSDP